MPHLLKNLLLIALTGFALSACSYFDPETYPTGKNTPSETIDVTNPNISGLPGEVQAIESMPLAETGPPPAYPNIVKKSTNGSVEIFPVDGAAPSAPVAGGSAPASMPASSKGVAVNPSVEIFPLDEQMGSLLGGTGVNGFVSAPGTSSFPSASTAIIYYAHGSSALDREDLELIARLAASAKNGSASVQVEGHASVQSEIADPVMRKIANLKISMDRAFKVSAELMKKGVPAERIETKAYGEIRPPKNIPAGKDDNSAARRVEIYGLPEE